MKAGQKEAKSSQDKLISGVADTISKSTSLSELCQKISEIFSKITKVDAIFIYLASQDEQELKLIFPQKAKEALSLVAVSSLAKLKEEIFKKKKPFKGSFQDKIASAFYKKTDTFKSCSYFPILDQNNTIGLIALGFRKKCSLSRSQSELLSIISKLTGPSIKSLGLTKKKEEQLGLLSEISSTIVSSKYLQEILNLIVTLTSQVLNSKICSIMLLDKKRDELFIAATQSLSQSYTRKPNIKVGQSISGKVLKNKKPLTVLDVTKESGYMYPEVAKKEGIVSMLSVPMMVKDKAIGVINLYTDREHKFTQDEINTLLAVANQAAVAIENTNLTTEILNVREALESRKLTERAKGILMKQLGIDEQEAYRLMQKKSMDLRKSMKEVAEAIIVAEDITR